MDSGETIYGHLAGLTDGAVVGELLASSSGSFGATGYYGDVKGRCH